MGKINQSEKKKISMLAAFVIAVLSFGSFVTVMNATGNVHFGISSVFADEGEDDEDEDEDKDDDEDEDEDEDKDDDEDDDKDDQEKEAEKKAKELAKEKAKKDRELLKKQADDMRNDDDEDDDSDELEDEEENEEEDELNEKRAEILEDIYEDIIEAEEDIMKAQAEGVDVTKALATLAIAKEKAKLAEASFSSTDLSAAKKLAKEVKKLAHFAQNEEIHTAKKIAEEIRKVSKRLSQTEGKIALYVRLGGDGGKFTDSLNVLRNDFTAAKDLIAQGGNANIESGLDSLEVIDRKAKAIKNSVATSLYALGGTDERLDDDYEEEVEDMFEHLSDAAEIEGDELGEEIKKLAESQREAAKNVGKTVKSIDERNQILQLLFGTKRSELDGLNAEIAANEARIVSLTEASNKIEDAEIKAIITEQVENLKEETLKLKTFVSGQQDRLSALGWFFNLF